MNQRISRNRDKKNRTDFVSLATGGHVSRHTPNEVASVQVPQPQKATGDIKPVEPSKGTAKASPNFKRIEPPAKAMSKEDEKKIVSANSEPVKEDEDTEKQ